MTYIDMRIKSLQNKLTKTSKVVDFGSIPEPTKSLLFMTDAPLSKFKDATSVTMTIGFKKNVESDDFYSEPSLIWIRLPVEKNYEVEASKIYYPSYARLDTKCRFQYLNWLKDISKETNLSYVFLYYYGLERHLLIGNYDLAVDEIVRLMNYHDQGSFKLYSSVALLAASAFRKRPDILERAPFMLETLSNIGLFLRWQIRKDLDAKEIMELSNRVGFRKKTYIRNKPEFFLSKLHENVMEYTRNNGLILESINLDDIPKKHEVYFANTSIPRSIRTILTPQILENEKFKTTIFNLLNSTHEIVKNEKKK